MVTTVYIYIYIYIYIYKIKIIHFSSNLKKKSINIHMCWLTGVSPVTTEYICIVL